MRIASFLRILGRTAAAGLIAAAGLLPGATVSAQEQPRTIRFEEAISIALERNTNLRRSENATELAQIAVEQQRMQFFPNLSVSLGGNQNYGRNFSQEEGRIVNQTTRSFSTSASTGLTLFDGFANTSGLREARLSYEATGLDQRRMEETVVVTVIQNYLAMIEAQEQLGVQRENLESQIQQEAQIQAFVDAGSRPISDLYQQQATVAAARATVVQAERTLQLSQLDLIQTLHLDPVGSYVFEVPAIDEEVTLEATPNVEELLGRAFAQRSDLEATDVRLRAAEVGVRSARASAWPTVSLSGGYSTNFTSQSDFSFFDQLDQRRGGQVGLRVSLPIFDRFATRQNTQRALVQVENARLDVELERQTVAVEVQRAYLDFRAAQEQLRAAEAQLEAANRALEATQDRYDVGSATLLELTQSRAAQVSATSSLVRARYTLVAQERLIAYYTGSLEISTASLD